MATETDSSPFDSAAGAVSRFAIEVVAWIAGPWAMVSLTGSWWLAIGAGVALVAIPALFNTPGDKKFSGIPTPGPARVVIEMLLLIVAVWSSWFVWPTWAAIATTAIGAALLAFGRRRYRWLAEGAPTQSVDLRSSLSP